MKYLIVLLLVVVSGNGAHAQNFWMPIECPKDSIGIGLGPFPYYAPKNNILFGLSPKGLFRSDDHGLSWYLTSTQMKYSWLISLAESNHKTLFGADQKRISYRSTDGGASWAEISQLSNKYVVQFYTTSSDDIFAGVGNEGIWHSTDDGLHWKQLEGGFPTTHWGQCIIKLSNGDLLVSTGLNGDYGIYRSSDNGATWSISNVGIEGTLTWCLAEAAKGTVLAGTMNHGIFRSVDYGNTWIRSSDGLKDSIKSDVQSLLVDGSGVIYSNSGFDIGHHRSTDDGKHWIQCSSGISEKDYGRFTIDNEGYLYCNARQSLYRATEKVTPNLHTSIIPKQLPISIYPNPATSEISIHIPDEAEPTIQVFDILGRELLSIKGIDHMGLISVKQFLNGTYYIKSAGRTTMIIKQ